MAECTGHPGTTFDQLTKNLASGVSRRDALKLVAAGMTGALLTTLGVRKAHAGAKCNNKGVCGTYSNCGNSGSCFCGDTGKQKGFCFEDAFCSDLVACSSNGQCKSQFGKGWKCVQSTCCDSVGKPNVCLSKCGSGVAATGSGARASGG
jgi:hypothetical protein